MKTMLKIALSAAVILLGTQTASAQWGNKKVVGNGNVTTKTVNTSDYDGVNVVGSMDVHLEKGSEGNISVTTDDNLHEYIIIEIKGDDLVIKTKKNVYLKTKKGIHVTVPFDDISKVSLTGSGDVDTKDAIDTQNLDVSLTGSGDIVLAVNTGLTKADITGSGDMNLSGKTVNLEVGVTGSGDFSGFDLQADDTDAYVSGSGDVRVVANKSLKARVSGSGDIVYKGNPEKSDTKTSGSGDIDPY